MNICSWNGSVPPNHNELNSPSLDWGLLSVYSWAGCEPMREDVTHVTSSLIGSELAQPHGLCSKTISVASSIHSDQCPTEVLVIFDQLKLLINWTIVKSVQVTFRCGEMGKCPGIHFTNRLWDPQWNFMKILFSLVWIVMIKSHGKKFAHVTTTELPWRHVQNCDLNR